jgi:hypothetical protein
MAYGVTTDARPHVLGDLQMVTGTFTDGGTEYNYSNQLSVVLAAGGHFTSLVGCGVSINNAGTEAVGQTVLTCDTTSVAGDCRSCLTVGQTLYGPTGLRLGIVTVVTATEVTIDTALTVALADDTPLRVLGATSMALKANAAITSHTVGLDVSIDETNKLVIFAAGNESSAHDTSSTDGRWWILGQR